MEKLIKTINTKLESVLCTGENVGFIAMNPNTWNSLVNKQNEYQKHYSIQIKDGVVKNMKPLEELEKELSNLDSILEQESERYDNVRIERKKIKIEIETRRLTSMVVDSFVKTKTDDKTTVYLKITKVDDPDEDEGTAFIYGYGFYKNNSIIKGFRYESDELESITESEFYNEFEIVKKEINKIIKF